MKIQIFVSKYQIYGNDEKYINVFINDFNLENKTLSIFYFTVANIRNEVCCIFNFQTSKYSEIEFGVSMLGFILLHLFSVHGF